MNIDKENFLSSDDKSVFLWNLNKANRETSYSLVNFDKTKNNSEPIISNACFNQFGNNSMFLYCLSTGDINICDIREKSDFSKKSSILL